MKKLVFRLIQLLCLLSFILMLLHHSLIVKYAKDGVLVWASCVLPLLLPFIILSKFWIRYKIPELFFCQIKKIFPVHTQLAVSFPILLLGLCSGFPVGAVFISYYYQNGTINKQLAETLLPLASFVSPMFVAGYIHSQIHLKGIYWFYYLFNLYFPVVAYYFLTQILKQFKMKRSIHNGIFILSEKHSANIAKKPQHNPCSKLSITEEIWIPSLEIIFIIGIYMMIFSILLGMLTELPLFETPVLTFFLANLEVTTGIRLLAASELYTPKIMYSLTAAAASFGGMCTMAQVQTIIAPTNLSLKPYMKIKLFTASLTLLLCLLFL